MNTRVFLVVAVAVILLFSAAPSRWAGPSRRRAGRSRADEGDALVLSALQIIAHFDPLMWVIENPATGP